MKAVDLTLRFRIQESWGSLPAPEIAQIPPIGFAHAVENDGMSKPETRSLAARKEADLHAPSDWRSVGLRFPSWHADVVGLW